MQNANALEMLSQGAVNRLGQHGASILIAFALADGDLIQREIEILDPQAQAFEHPQPGPVENQTDQAVGAVEVAENVPGFVAGEHDGQALRPVGPDDARNLPRFDFEHGQVEKQDRVERLILRTRRDLALDGQVREELVDLGDAHLLGVAFVVKENEPLGPVVVGIFSANAHVPDLARGPESVEEFRGLWRAHARLSWPGSKGESTSW